MTIGWYVHHHGAGHLHRFLATREHLDEVVGLSSLPAPPGLEDAWFELPLDLPAPPERDGGPSPPWLWGADPSAGGALHWAPLGCDGLRDRMAAIAGWIADSRAAALVVDVSVEVALLARLLGVPTVVVAQRGVRHDAPHRTAYTCASAVVAPWTRESHLAGDGPPDERLAFAGAISRFDRLPAPAPASGGGDVLLVVGAGGHALDAGDVAAAARATGRRWHVAGALRVPGHPLVTDHGADADVWALLGACDVAVGTGGGNVVAEVAAARRPFVCLPQARPFDEQRRQGEALRRLGVAEVRDAPVAPGDWPAVLAQAERRDTGRWALVHDGRGADRLAAVVRDVATAVEPACA